MKPPTEFKVDYIAADGTPIMWIGHAQVWEIDGGYHGQTFTGVKVAGDFAKVASVCAANQPANDLTQWR
jgi:hypothetical protein